MVVLPGCGAIHPDYRLISETINLSTLVLLLPAQWVM